MAQEKICQVLVKHGYLSAAQLAEMQEHVSRYGGSIIKAIEDKHYVDPTKLAIAKAEVLAVPYLELKYYKIKADKLKVLPEKMARRFRAIVIDEVLGSYLVAMADPSDLGATDEVKNRLDKPVRFCMVLESEIIQVITELYSRSEEISSLASELHQEMQGEGAVLLEEELARIGGTQDAPVIKLLNSIFEEALQTHASDIHIEPDQKILRIRQRIDGVLHEQIMEQKGIASALVSRLKLMAGLNISEKRLPQDGRFLINIKGSNVDVRMSTMPIRYGESVVLRILDSSQGLLSLDQLGMGDDLLKRFRHQIHRPYGMIVVTGPTGSGKTTTLYAALNELNQPEKKIISVEDPVEYTIERINQIQINPKIDLNFGNVLRSAMRQDPDIIMIGEMRDEITARIGIRASITGHLVLSTLHTNDAISSATRLLDMGVDGYLVASALRAIVAQRLMRRTCEFCVEEYTPTAKEMAWVEGVLGDKAKDIQFYHGRGCTRCKNTGYRGRVGIYELLEITDEMTDALRSGDTREFVARVRSDKNFVSLIDSALENVAKGVTSLPEVLRVVGDISEYTVD